MHSSLPVVLVEWPNGVRGVRIDAEVGSEYFVVVHGGLLPTPIIPKLEHPGKCLLGQAVEWAGKGPRPRLHNIT